MDSAEWYDNVKPQPLEDELRPLRAPAVQARFGAQEVATGALIPKIQRVRTFSADEWEEFVEEWAHSLHDTYVKVRRYGGSGDMGCDIVGFLDEKELRGRWVDYQCKHYDQPVSPSKIWVEIGKLCWYSYRDEYTWPVRYYFVAPRGVGTKLGKLLNDADTLKQRLLEKWIEKCENCITSTQIVSLTAGLRDFIENLDFSIFDSLSVNDVIESHSRTCWHSVRFGGGLPPRPEIVPVPIEVQRSEIRYVEQLLEAYSDDLKQRVDRPDMLQSWPRLKAHFGRSREQFFSAEALKSFSRDAVPPGTFEQLQQEIYDGIIDTCELGDHASGLKRVMATVDRAGVLNPGSNPLFSRVETRDKQGICHQLANEDRLIWVPKRDG